MQNAKRLQRNRSVFVALFAALISVSAVFSIPLPGGVPIVLKDMLAILSGTVLGSVQGAGAVGLYLIAGMVGLPVFSGGAGLAALTSPSGGYLVGYFVGSLAAGLMLGRPTLAERHVTGQSVFHVVRAALTGWVILYVFGVAQLMRVNHIPLAVAIASGVMPFLPFAAVKLALLIMLTIRLRPIAARYINDDPGNVEPDLTVEEAADIFVARAKAQVEEKVKELEGKKADVQANISENATGDDAADGGI
jgi:biotin transport system substrate-specific component